MAAARMICFNWCYEMLSYSNFSSQL